MPEINETFPTLYPDVNNIVGMVCEGAQAVLDERFYGMYLYGSMAIGDFNPGRSDIDFIVITTNRLSDNQMSLLKQMHLDLWDKNIPWADKLEGVYVSKDAIYTQEADGPVCLMLNEKQFFSAALGNDWIINRHILREKGVTVVGPSLRSLLRPVTKDELREAIVTEFKERWMPFVKDAGLFARFHYQPFVVLTICRAYYTFINGTVEGKTKSADWALENLPDTWSNLIRTAMSWQYGDPSGDIPRTQEFMRYVIRQAGIAV